MTIGKVLGLILLCASSVGSLMGQEPAEPKKAPQEVAKLLVGKWGIDVPQMMAEAKRALEKERRNGGDEAAEERIKEMYEMFERMGHLMMVELTADGKAIPHSPDGDETGKYQLLKADDAKGAFTLEMIHQGGHKQTTTGQVKGDKMFLNEKNAGRIHLKRLTAEEAKKIEAAIAEAADGNRVGPDAEIEIDPPEGPPE